MLKRGRAAPRRVALLLGALALGCSAGGSADSGAAAGSAGESTAPYGGAANGEGGRGGVQGQPSVGAGGAAAAVGGASGATQSAAGAAGGSATAGGSDGVSGGASAGSGGGSAGGAVVGIPKNPILPGLNADPQIAIFNGKFYIYPTTDGFDNWMSTSFHAFSSSDLLTWKDEGVILALGGSGVSWAKSQAWAPGIVFKGGTYYFYFAAGMQIGVATSSSPTGPFKDALGKPLISTSEYGVASIDPYAFTDDNGSAYLYFGSGGSGRVVKLNPDMVSFSGTPTTLTPSGFREGSVAFKRNGKYYFMYSVGDTRNANYNVAYAMGASPLGPFTKVATVLQEDPAQGILATGHNSVLELPNGDWYIAYHRFKVPACSAAVTTNCGDGTHREVCLDKLTFNADGTISAIKPTL